MTLKTCKLQLELYKAQGNAEKVAYWEARVARKLAHPNYAHLRPVEAKPVETKSGKKPKR